MTFLYAPALWGLGTLALFVLFSLWRLRPRRVIAPSIALWTRLEDRRPPVRALQRPRPSLLLIVQMLAAACLVLAWAVPALLEEEPAPRRIALVFDASASMGPRIERAKERARELLGMLLSTDEVTVAAAHPAPAIHRGDPRAGIEAVRAGAEEGDVLAAARAMAADVVYVFTDEPLEEFRTVGTGRSTNSGIVEARAEAEGLFVRIAHTGEPATRILTVLREGREVERRTLRIGEPGVFLTLPEGDEVRMDPDAFPLDDRVVGVRGGPVDVVWRGERHPRLLKAFSSMKDVRIGGRGEVTLCYRSVPGGGESGFRIVVAPPSGFAGVRVGDSFPVRPGTLAVAAGHPLLRSVDPSEIAVHAAREIRMEGGEPVLWADRKPVVVVKDDLLVIGLEWHSEEWPVFPSFPIFWTNAIRYARRSAPAGVTFPKIRAGSGGNLLSERETLAPGLEERPLDPPPEPGRRRSERPFDPVLLAAAAVLAAVSFLLGRE